MEITLVKAAGPGAQDRAWLTVGGAARRGPVHVTHDLPHLVVESLFGITDGLWAELAARVPRGSRPCGNCSRPQAPQAGADRLRGTNRCPNWRVAHARAPPRQDHRELRDQPAG